MGMYTQIKVDCRLRDDAPAQVVEVLRFLANDKVRDDPGFALPDHEFFSCDRWRHILCMSSAYFDDDVTAAFVEIDGQWRLLGCANLKNYDGEIGKFFNWLQPFVDADRGDVIGCHRYEEFEISTPVEKE